MNILKVLGYSEEVVSLQRALICGGKLTIWDFFEAVHSEQKNDIAENRGYIIETHKRKIFIGYENIAIEGYHCINLPDLLRDNPIISRFISKIRDLETIYRRTKSIPKTVMDDVHQLLNI